MPEPIMTTFGLVSTVVGIATGTVSLTVSIYNLIKWGIGTSKEERRTEIGAKLDQLKTLLQEQVNEGKSKVNMEQINIYKEEIDIIDKALDIQSIIYTIIKPVLIRNFFILAISTILICFFISIDFKSFRGVFHFMPGVEIFDLLAIIIIFAISYWAFKQTSILRDQSLISFFDMTVKIENLLFKRMRPVLDAYNSWANEKLKHQFPDLYKNNG